MSGRWIAMVGALALLGCGSGEQKPAPQQPAEVAPATTGLRLEAAPRGWQPRAKDPASKKAFLVDYDLPGGARVNVLPCDVGFEAYLEKLIDRWTTKGGAPLTRADVAVMELPIPGGLAGRTIEVSGTRHPHDGPEEHDMRLLAVHLTPMEGEGYWTAWLIGKAEAVDARRAEYLTWVRAATVR